MLIKYNVNNVRRISAIFWKLIPSPPDNLLINPLYISVVAFPNIFGPTIEKIVPPIANIITITTAILYLDK